MRAGLMAYEETPQYAASYGVNQISRIDLHQFRNYQQARLDGIRPGAVVLWGANGAGKTNILEAISLLVPGRGLRRCRPRDVLNVNAGPSDIWSVGVDLHTEHGAVRLATGLDLEKEKRVVRVNGESVRSQSVLAQYLSCVWLTPQMDRLFMDSTGSRRQFLDRMVFAFDPKHSARMSRYENAVSQRSKLLKEGMGDVSWITGLEAQIAEVGVAIAAARLDFAQRLQAACDYVDAEEEKYFPAARIHVAGFLEDALAKHSALDVQELFMGKLRGSRQRDAILGGSAFGPHRSDLQVWYAAKGMKADQCSTGEQKALLIGLILSQARLLLAEKGVPPLMLLDEVAAHLDEERRMALYDRMFALGGQVWMTGTDIKLFNGIRTRAQFFELRDGQVAQY